MDIKTSFMEKSGAYLVSERHRREQGLPERPRPTNPAITISYKIGTGAPQVAEELSMALQKTEDPGNEAWEVFNQQLVERALQQQRWPKKLAESIKEEKRFFIDEVMDDLFSLRPPSWVLMPQVIETTLNLAVSGHAILVGHGATIVTAELPNVFHVRLTGSLSKRIERLQMSRGLTHEDAERLVKTEDHKREKFLKAHFHTRPDKELLYDVTVNTDRISTADAVTIIFDAARLFFSTL
jgi:cytidylate kinase